MPKTPLFKTSAPRALGQVLLLTAGLVVSQGGAFCSQAVAQVAPPPGSASPAAAKAPLPRAWDDARLSPDERADLVLAKMTLHEKLQLTFGYFSTQSDKPASGVKNFELPKEGLPASAGFVPGVPRLGVPNQWLSDAGMGVASQQSKTPRLRTSLPSGMAVASTWNPELARKGGAMIGNEAFLSGFNVLLAGALNLVREPRNGRNFEYAGEDPLLAGMIAGNQIKGVQSQNVISTMKHFAFNGQETRRTTIDHKIDEQAARQSDLLAFEIAHEVGQPGSVMCAYNRVNGFYACENDWLLNQVLKRDWGFKGYVMSDWGATHSTTQAANAGLDQQSGWPFDRSPYFADALREAVNNGYVSEARADDMARRILRAMFAAGLFDKRVNGDASATIDYGVHAAVTQAAAEEGIVLLKNTAGLLPLSKRSRSILIVGNHADIGVLSGGGSSQVYAHGSPTNGMIVPNEGPSGFPGPKVYHPSSPMKALQARTSATVTYLDGKDVQAAAAAAARADVVIVFAEQWLGESADARNLDLPGEQNALIAAVADANKNSVVVLQTGGPVIMPWLPKVGAVLEAWYPGTSGGEAIARILTGQVNPSGRLPVTFPAATGQLPRPAIEGLGTMDPNGHPTSNYDVDGAAVGYKWFDKTGAKPLFPFGYGLSYTSFDMGGLTVKAEGRGLQARVVVRNTGPVRGKAVVQIYVSGQGWEAPRRLGGFSKVDLKPGEKRAVTVPIDPRLLATFDVEGRTWRITGGGYQVTLASSASDPIQSVNVDLPASSFVQGPADVRP
ncbi:glycoside hydrolase family 3 C-terminal domain-containing protein [Caulobacter radicis]|uniref:Glycosyl hydrolase n=1 Tax=Caulobacter radicis TaxID=2172650 RepID=A0A2T9J7E7_9CAUL|nr:glycoside hydrolase family 3 C-terminal domain-containing protein [Caulobacter radicis]PVM77460.1 glycosyl hydrolase [Caulobacter radicis]